jgi:hypothetical protein
MTNRIARAEGRPIIYRRLSFRRCAERLGTWWSSGNRKAADARATIAEVIAIKSKPDYALSSAVLLTTKARGTAVSARHDVSQDVHPWAGDLEFDGWRRDPSVLHAIKALILHRKSCVTIG